MFLNEVILLEGAPWWKTWGRSAAALRAARRRPVRAVAGPALLRGRVHRLLLVRDEHGRLGAPDQRDDLGGARLGDLYGVRFQLALWLAIAFFTVARFLTYIDHRIRKEGWEIKLRLQHVGRVLEETQA